MQWGGAGEERVEQSVLSTSAQVRPVPLISSSGDAPQVSSGGEAPAQITQFDGRSGLPAAASEQPWLLIKQMKEHAGRSDILVQCCIALKVCKTQSLAHYPRTSNAGEYAARASMFSVRVCCKQ